MADATLEHPKTDPTEGGAMATTPALTKVSLPLTKILATLGPATDSDETIIKLIQTGVTNFRLNFSHGSFENHLERLKRVRDCAEQLGPPVAVLGDLQGPKIRVGDIPGSGFDLPAGEKVIISVHPSAVPIDRAGVEEASIITCNYARLPDEVEPGHRVLINDGNIRMLCVESDQHSITCTVTYGGLVTSRKGINLPDSDLSVSALTEKDIKFVHWAIEQQLDFLALSFVRTADDVQQLRNIVTKHCTTESCGVGFDGPDSEPIIPTITKIETPQAVKNIDEIIKITNGLMIARGDLGVEMDVASVPVIQKKLVAVSHAHGKPCIVATQMLESMIDSPSPTRAEASDVANAVFDGCDAVMLSGETAVGKYPDITVETMQRIIKVTEARMDEMAHAQGAPLDLKEYPFRSAALARGVWHMAEELNAKAVVVWSQAGGMARYLSQTGFRVPILALSSSRSACRRMNFLGGVVPIESPPPADGTLASWTDEVEKLVMERGYAEKGDAVVLIAGKPLGSVLGQDTLAVLRLGDPGSGFRAGDH